MYLHVHPLHGFDVVPVALVVVVNDIDVDDVLVTVVVVVTGFGVVVVTHLHSGCLSGVRDVQLVIIKAQSLTGQIVGSSQLHVLKQQLYADNCHRIDDGTHCQMQVPVHTLLSPPPLVPEDKSSQSKGSSFV